MRVSYEIEASRKGIENTFVLPLRATSRARRSRSPARSGVPRGHPLCSYFTIANVLINDECAKRRSICIALLLLIRDLCTKLGAVVLIGDFNKTAERELPAGGSEGQRRISPIDAVFGQRLA